jgi:hypothetical protein
MLRATFTRIWILRLVLGQARAHCDGRLIPKSQV